MADLSPDISLKSLGEAIAHEKAIIGEMNSLFNYLGNSNSQQEKNMISSQIGALNSSLKIAGQQVLNSLEKISIFRPLSQPQTTTTSTQPATQFKKVPLHDFSSSTIKPGKPLGKLKMEADDLESLTIERLKRTDKKILKVKEKKPSSYIKFASKFFHKYSMSLIEKGHFKTLERDLIKANMEFVPAAYVSVIFFTTMISWIIAFFATLFFQFLSLSALPPFISRVQESFFSRFIKVIWIMVFVPLGTFLLVYFYPTMERRSTEGKINQELPFAVIHMSSISSSMIEPSKIFAIISATKEYPFLEKEFTKLQNEINVYGYDLVTALKNRSLNSPSKKLSELFNGLSTTITSGGNLPEFFDKRAQTLLFEHKLDREKQGKANETFMDIYISVVIAAPMILMLLLMMMRISGLGVSLSTSTITLIMVLGVTVVNIFFLTFLHLKRPAGA